MSSLPSAVFTGYTLSSEGTTPPTNDSNSSKHKGENRCNTECPLAEHEPASTAPASRNQPEIIPETPRDSQPKSSGPGVVAPSNSKYCQVCVGVHCAMCCTRLHLFCSCAQEPAPQGLIGGRLIQSLHHLRTLTSDLRAQGFCSLFVRFSAVC